MRVVTVLVLGLVMMGCGYSSRNYNSGGMPGTGTPKIDSLAPASTAAGSAGFTLTVNGSNFGSGAVVYFNGVAEATMFVSSKQITASIPASAVGTAGSMPVYVHSGVYNSNTMNFTVQ